MQRDGTEEIYKPNEAEEEMQPSVPRPQISFFLHFFSENNCKNHSGWDKENCFNTLIVRLFLALVVQVTVTPFVKMDFFLLF